VKRIICGTDFSTHAAEAANVAAALAARHNATLTLLHAVSPWQVEALNKATLDAVRNERRRMLIAEGRRLRESGAQVLEHLLFGTPHEMLARAAHRIDANLIVVSSLGEVSAWRWIAGSVALRTAQKAPVPTLVVRDDARLMAWVKREGPLKVFACYDFSPTSDSALRWIASLREWGPCDVTVTYVSWPPEESWRLGILDPTANGNNTPVVQVLLERGIEEKCECVLGAAELKIHVVSNWGRADVHLNDLARTSDADLVVVGTNHRNLAERFWIGSVSRSVIRRSRTNVVCVPASYVSRAARADISKGAPVPIDFTEAIEESVAITNAAPPRNKEACLTA
jgi:nucleotide-binding universal stress UspA family protein